MFHSSFIEISKSALQNNISFLRQQLAPQVRLSSVIKGNAYGHGIETFAPLAQDCGIDHFSVFSADEALRLKNVLTAPATILILGYIDEEELPWAVEHDIEFFVFDLNRLEAAIEVAKKLGKPAIVHIELETGMNRTGFEDTSWEEAKQLLKENRKHLRLRGLCTHFAGAESIENHERVLNQLQAYNKEAASLKEIGLQAEQYHTACSAAMMAYPATHMDMVRIGIMQYGFWPSPETKSQYMRTSEGRADPLQRLITWKSKIMSFKKVKAGNFVGYGSTFRAEADMLLAVIPVGYAWGYSRTLSNQGHVLIHEKRCPVVGIVNMNIMMADVTHIAHASIGDEVVLLGTQGSESITVVSFAELSTQLNYELLTRLPINIPRVVVD